MTPSTDPDGDRLEALLADLALDGLTPSELAQVIAFGGVNDDRFDLVASAVDFGLWREESLEPMPQALAARILEDYRTQAALAPLPATVPATLPITRPGARVLPWLGWVAAAAALIALAIVWNRPRVVIAPSAPPTSFPVVRQPTEAERLEQLAANARKAPLKATDHPLAQGAAGELVWNGEQQAGFMKINGLAPVDPKKGTYQLWIFDKNRDKRYPVDGGTFTLAENETSKLIPIRAKLNVDEPTLFAITLEPPGGVVVSDRQRIMLTAAWGEG